jgi:glycine C-acetyltransferase
MHDRYRTHVRETLARIRVDGFHKAERVIVSPQSPRIALAGGAQVLNFCANNYLGLANDSRLIEAAHEGLARHGFGTASVRFICGTQDVHKQLEAALAAFLGTEDAILYSSCFDANGGLFETLLTEDDAVISDELNHASIVDGIRLCKARRYRYRNNDMADLEAQLREAAAAGARFTLIATDGVFSMDGTLATRWGSSASTGAARRKPPAHASTSSPERWARRWAARRGGTWRRRVRSSNCCASARGRTCSRTACRR